MYTYGKCVSQRQFKDFIANPDTPKGQEDKKTLEGYGSDFETEVNNSVLNIGVSALAIQKDEYASVNLASKITSSDELASDQSARGKSLNGDLKPQLQVKCYIDSEKRSYASQIRTKVDPSNM
jgi:hypothetical protein